MRPIRQWSASYATSTRMLARMGTSSQHHGTSHGIIFATATAMTSNELQLAAEDQQHQIPMTILRHHLQKRKADLASDQHLRSFQCPRNPSAKLRPKRISRIRCTTTHGEMKTRDQHHLGRISHREYLGRQLDHRRSKRII